MFRSFFFLSSSESFDSLLMKDRSEMYCSYLIVLSMTAEIELATFGSEVKCLTPRPSWICKKRCFLDSSKHAARPGKNENLQNWCGNILSLVWKFFFSGVEIFRLLCGHFSFSILSFNRSEEFPHQSRKIYTPETKKIHERQQISTPETKNVHTRDKIFPKQNRKVRREIFAVITIIFTTPAKKFE